MIKTLTISTRANEVLAKANLVAWFPAEPTWRFRPSGATWRKAGLLRSFVTGVSSEATCATSSCWVILIIVLFTAEKKKIVCHNVLPAACTYVMINSFNYYSWSCTFRSVHNVIGFSDKYLEWACIITVHRVTFKCVWIHSNLTRLVVKH